ncbi:S-layer protein SlaA [Metallosphaera javensis (ex Sakai et al. 2022)]|uniref:S-layer protein SlaA n=1 Tax=Metallosphaera javensis (ex Sakai et al. 2022) TaxID=2775498 RepID=UPI00258E24DC|nr:MAG: S-layer protein A [Metallosphaera javensis (ex Sakai et al. 2022)]
MNAIRYVSILLVVLMGGSFISGIFPLAQPYSTVSGVTIAANSYWIGPDQVILVSVYNPNVPQTGTGAKYVLGNLSITGTINGVATTLNLTSLDGSVYYVENGQHFFWFFIAIPTGTTSSGQAAYIPSNYVTLTNSYLTKSGNQWYFKLPSNLPFSLVNSTNTIGKNGEAKVANLAAFSGSKTIQVKYSTGASVTLQNYLVQMSSYTPGLVSVPTQAPLNSTWEMLFNSSVMQADPLVGNNGGFTVTHTEVYGVGYVHSSSTTNYTFVNVTYPAILTGKYVNVTVTDNPIPNALALFGYGGVYNGNLTVWASSVVTNSSFAIIANANTTLPSNATYKDYYNLTVRDHYFTPNTPIEITVEDYLNDSNNVMLTGTIKETTPQSFSVSTTSSATLAVNAFDNISNFSTSKQIMAGISLVGQSGKSYYSTFVMLNESAPGSGVFQATVKLTINKTVSIQESSSYTITIYLPPYDFSNTTILVNATNDVGASFYYLGSTMPRVLTTPSKITPETAELVPEGTVTLGNVTPVIQFAYNEFYLALGTATTLVVSGNNILYSNALVATDSVTAVLPNGTPITGNLNSLGITRLSSANGNGTFLVIIPSTLIHKFLKLNFIPSNTELTFKIYDEFTAQTLSVTYKFTTVAPVIAVETPTSTSFSSAETAYLPPLPYNVIPEKHYISVHVTDTLYAQSVPSSSLEANLTIIVEKPNGYSVGYTTTFVSETAANSGLFTTQLYYTVVSNKYGYWFEINGQNITNLKNVVNGGIIVFKYVSPSSQSTVNATVILKPSPFTLTVSQSTANPGQYVNVSVSSPGLVEANNMKFTGSLTIYAQFASWAGPGSQPNINVSPVTLKEVSPGSPVFGGTIVLGNSSVVSSGNLTSIITSPGETVAPGSVVLVNANATIGPTSTSSPTPYYQQQSISINVESVNVSILNPSPASPFATLEIELQSPLFNLLTHPAAGNYTTAGASHKILEGIISTITTQQSQQLVTSTQLVTSSNTSFYYNNTIWVIKTPMTLWNGTPGSYGIPIAVNLTDLLTVTHNVYAIHVVEVPNVRTGTVSLVSAYAVPSVSSQVAQLQINGLVPPVISVFFNGNNITQSPSGAVPFPNTTAGELVNITVYAPDAVNNPHIPGAGTTFNVTIINTANGETTTLTLTQMTKIVSGVAISTPYYTGLLKVVEPTVYRPGTPGEISASSGVVNKVLVNMNLVEGSYYNTQGLLQQLRMKASSYFYVGVIKLSVLVSHFTILSNGTPVTSMQVGKSYSLLFNVTNNGNVNETIYGTVEVLLNNTPVQPETIAQISLAPGQSTQLGILFTPTMPGNYTITFIPFQNNLLSIPYNPGLTEVVTAS